MKRFISLLIALVLLVSMFALPTFALAEETTPNDPEAGEDVAKRNVGFSVEAFKELVVANNKGLYIEMSKEFKLSQDWIDDADKVHALFPGELHYILLPAEEDVDDVAENKFKVTYKAGGEGAKADQADVTEEYLKTKHVTLKSATTFTAAEGYEFAGWLATVDYDGSDAEVLYRAGDKFAMPAKNVEVVAKWRKVAEEGEEAEEIKYTHPVNDKISLEYCTPSDDPRDEDWTRVSASSSISLQTSGWWMFRYVVVDGTKDSSDDDVVLTPYNTDDFKQGLLSSDGKDYDWSAFCLKRYAIDTKNPEIALTSTLKNKMEEGLTVGTTYSVSTTLDITDSSSTTVTYKVFRFDGVDGAKDSKGDKWVLIYDSAADTKVVEGYEKYISDKGIINPNSDDVTAENHYRYKVVYSVKDENGYFGISKEIEPETGDVDENGEFHPVLLLGVKLSPTGIKEKQKMAIWKIILFVIAGLSAVGIVVLLLIKPKQAVEGDARVSAVNDTDGKNGDLSDTSDGSTDDAE